MFSPVLIDLSHTSHTRARTGIQRVARSLLSSLGEQALPITHDPHLRAWRLLESWEQENLGAKTADRTRGAQWPLEAKMRARAQRWLRHRRTSHKSKFPEHQGILVPEVFSAEAAQALPALFGATTGPRVAIFHDAIALKFPELTPPKTVARFPAYLQELLAFDGIAANSEDSRDSLIDYWKWAGVAKIPQVTAISLGVDVREAAPVHPAPASALPVVLCVGSIEGRKNHVTLLAACEKLWERGMLFELRLIGLTHPQTGRVALEKINALKFAGRSLCYNGPLADSAVDTAYAECAFTVYPSVIEGFGLPVIESLAHGKPCVCSGRGAIGESARGGGCVAVDVTDASQLAATIARLLESPAELSILAQAARARRFKSWADYTAELMAWMQGLSRRLH
jgi:glycosyltransferase involved in cell wall biosynthesis